MNEMIHQLFDERYWKAARFCNIFHIIYALLCGFIAGFAFTLGIFPETSAVVWVSTMALPAICYPLMLFKLFRPWSSEGIKKRIMEATERIEGVAFQGQSFAGIHQVNFKYSIDGKQYKSSDLFDQVQHPEVGESIIVAYNPRKPSSSYIETRDAIQSR